MPQDDEYGAFYEWTGDPAVQPDTPLSEEPRDHWGFVYPQGEDLTPRELDPRVDFTFRVTPGVLHLQPGAEGEFILHLAVQRQPADHKLLLDRDFGLPATVTPLGLDHVTPLDEEFDHYVIPTQIPGQVQVLRVPLRVVSEPNAALGVYPCNVTIHEVFQRHRSSNQFTIIQFLRAIPRVEVGARRKIGQQDLGGIA
jgi:hypothetical protein